MSLIGSLVDALAQGNPVEQSTPEQLRAEVMADMCITGSRADATRELCAALDCGARDLTTAINRYIRIKRLPELRDALQVEAVDHHDRKANHGAGLALAEGTMRRVADQYIRGDYIAAAQALVDGIHDDWYHRQYAGTLATEMKAAVDG